MQDIKFTKLLPWLLIYIGLTYLLSFILGKYLKLIWLVDIIAIVLTLLIAFIFYKSKGRVEEFRKLFKWILIFTVILAIVILILGLVTKLF